MLRELRVLGAVSHDVYCTTQDRQERNSHLRDAGRDSHIDFL